MKMCKELEEAIAQICDEYDQDEEFKQMLTKTIQNKLDNNMRSDDLEILIKKVTLDENETS